jgi:DNA uptake protein ComE-like DNA-binding protein
MHLRTFPLALLISTAMATACAPADGQHQGQQASQLAPTCEPLSASVSGIAFNNEEATRVVDMIDNATKTELKAIDGIGAKTADRIIDGRPYRSLQEPLAALDQVTYVGPRILTNLLAGSFENWCALDDGRQSCCIELACDAGTSVASVDLSVDDVHSLLDWANRANLSELDAVCGIGPSIAQSIVSARPMHSAAEVLAVPRIGNTTLFKILGKDGKSCSQQGSVSDEWCGQPDAQCLCNAGPGSSSFFLDEDAAFSLAEEAAGQLYLDTSDSIWEE